MRSLRHTARRAAKDTAAGLAAGFIITLVAFVVVLVIVLASRHLPAWAAWAVIITVFGGPLALDVYLSSP